LCWLLGHIIENRTCSCRRGRGGTPLKKKRQGTNDRRYAKINNYKTSSSTGDNKYAKTSWRIILSIKGVEEEKTKGSWREW
jgi:hypothetical protein